MGVDQYMTHESEEVDLRRKVPSADPADLTLERLRAGKIQPDVVTINRETLLAQAKRAEAEGYPQLARNFRRAAELTAIPNDILLQTYERLRPYRRVAITRGRARLTCRIRRSVAASACWA